MEPRSCPQPKPHPPQQIHFSGFFFAVVVVLYPFVLSFVFLFFLIIFFIFSNFILFLFIVIVLPAFSFSSFFFFFYAVLHGLQDLDSQVGDLA